MKKKFKKVVNPLKIVSCQSSVVNGHQSSSVVNGGQSSVVSHRQSSVVNGGQSSTVVNRQPSSIASSCMYARVCLGVGGPGCVGVGVGVWVWVWVCGCVLLLCPHPRNTLKKNILFGCIY